MNSMTSDESVSRITLAVLAGGQGRRMGQAKGNLLVHGRPILAYLLDRWQWTGPTMLVTSPGREHPPACDRFDMEVADPAPDLGPLRGILTAIQACRTSILVVATVDMPCIDSNHLRWIADQLQARPEYQGILLSRTRDDGARIEPFPSIYRASALNLIESLFAGGERSVHRMCALPEFEVIATPADWPNDTWTNLNVPEDLERFS